jgi:hypothetical protein
MSELEKMTRTAQRVIPDAPHEVLLVMDATTGQNGLEQARKFTESSGVTGIVLTKLDGTAKGGVIVAISRELGVPIRFVGVGEQVADLLPFDPEKFIESLSHDQRSIPIRRLPRRAVGSGRPARTRRWASCRPRHRHRRPRPHTWAGVKHAEIWPSSRPGAGQRCTSAEPCSHQGRTPPCADAVIAAGIARVVCPWKIPIHWWPARAWPGCARLELKLSWNRL